MCLLGWRVGALIGSRCRIALQTLVLHVHNIVKRVKARIYLNLTACSIQLHVHV